MHEEADDGQMERRTTGDGQQRMGERALRARLVYLAAVPAGMEGSLHGVGLLDDVAAVVAHPLQRQVQPRRIVRHLHPVLPRPSLGVARLLLRAATVRTEKCTEIAVKENARKGTERQ